MGPRIQEYTIADLKQLLNSRKWFADNPLPITKLRALSQANNPRAELNDVALLVAYDGDTVVAYLGILPDTAFVGDKRFKIGWLTAWWANPDRKFAGLGAMLLVRALKLYQEGLGASGFSADSKRVFAALKKFITIGDTPGLTGFACLDLAARLPRKWPLASKLRWLLRAGDGAIFKCSTLRQSLWRRRRPLPADFRLEYFPEFDQRDGEYIAKHHGQELTRRGAPELNWIYRHPWADSAPLAEPVSYFFSSTVKTRASYNLRVYDKQDQVVAMLMLIAIDGHLLVPYCYHDDQAVLCAQIIGHHLSLLRLKAFTTYRSDLLEAFSSLRFPWTWTLPRTRSWVMAGACAKAGPAGCVMQDGDGDLAFTL